MLLSTPAFASAQDVGATIGSRVRIWTSSSSVPLIGKLLKQEGGTLVLEADGAHGDPRTCNVAYGCNPQSFVASPARTAGDSAAMWATLGAPVGAILGLLAGPGRDHWKTITLTQAVSKPTTYVVATIAAHRVGVAGSVRW